MARYVLERRIGEGGMAEVFRAKAEGDSGFERVVAVKRLLPELAKDPKLQARFIDEARISGRLRHPNIVGVFDFYQEAGSSHLVMEFVDGVSLEHLVTRGLAGRFIPPAVSLRIALDVTRAIEHAHAQAVLHRDISTCNVLVSRDGEVKLADFGLADARERISSTGPGEIAGKVLYMSPERKAGETATTLDDLYSLGVVIERLLDATDPRLRSAPAAQALARSQGRLLADRPQRIPSATALAAELKDAGPAESSGVAELVRNNPQPRAPAPMAARSVRGRIDADGLDETTRSSQGGHDDTTIAETSPRLRAALLGAAAAAVLLAIAALFVLS